MRWDGCDGCNRVKPFYSFSSSVLPFYFKKQKMRKNSHRLFLCADEIMIIYWWCKFAALQTLQCLFGRGGAKEEKKKIHHHLSFPSKMKISWIINIVLYNYCFLFAGAGRLYLYVIYNKIRHLIWNLTLNLSLLVRACVCVCYIDRKIIAGCLTINAPIDMVYEIISKIIVWSLPVT